MNENGISMDEAVKRMEKIVKKSMVSVEEFGKALKDGMMAGSDAVKAAEAGRRLRKYLKDGLSIEEIKTLFKEE